MIFLYFFFRELGFFSSFLLPLSLSLSSRAFRSRPALSSFSTHSFTQQGEKKKKPWI